MYEKKTSGQVDTDCDSSHRVYLYLLESILVVLYDIILTSDDLGVVEACFLPVLR